MGREHQVARQLDGREGRVVGLVVYCVQFAALVVPAVDAIVEGVLVVGRVVVEVLCQVDDVPICGILGEGRTGKDDLISLVVAGFDGDALGDALGVATDSLGHQLVVHIPVDDEAIGILSLEGDFRACRHHGSRLQLRGTAESTDLLHVGGPVRGEEGNACSLGYKHPKERSQGKEYSPAFHLFIEQ